jgi:SAM-dependent methyltransferase
VSERSKYENRNPLHQYLLRRFLSAVTKAFVATGPRRVVEIGCANGHVYEFLKAHAGVDCEYQGYDVDDAALADARRRFPGVRFLHGNLYDLNVAADLILCLEVLEHLADPAEAVKRLAAMRAHRVIVSVPYEPWFRLGNLARGRHVGTLGNLPDHINAWNKKTLAALLTPFFQIVDDVSAFPWIVYLLRHRHDGAR